MAFASDKGRQGAAGQGGAATSYDIDNSLRFNDDDSAYLSRTPTTAGNQKTWTWSGWVKRGNLALSNRVLFMSYSSPTEIGLRFRDSDRLQFFMYTTGGYSFDLRTDALFRDSSAWYHIVVAFNTDNQSTATERVKIYINGEKVTSWDTESYPNNNTDYNVNDTNNHFLGSRGASTTTFDGYLAEVNFIDGYAKNQYDFGEFDATYGHWKPKAYAGTYGTNGFYLDFSDSSNSSSLGNDASSNSNNWTVNNLSITDQMLDSPTNNFATLNPLSSTSVTFSEGNTKVTASAIRTAASSFLITSGKWYAEASLNAYIGIQAPDGNFDSSLSVSGSNAIAYWTNGPAYWDGGSSGSGTSFTTSDVIGIAVDFESTPKTVKFYKNGSLIHDLTLGSGTIPNLTEAYIVYNNGASSARSGVFNFGQDSSFAGNKTAQGNTDSGGIGDFFYTPPTGFLALCTKNLPDVADGLWADGNNQAFNTVTYTGDGASTKQIEVGFKPGLQWSKYRNVTSSHFLTDNVRGVDAMLLSNSTTDESTTNATWRATYGQVDSFDDASGGFTGGYTLSRGSSTTSSSRNTNNGLYVAWNWKAGGTAVSNTDGTNTTAMVSANPTAGFSIVSYTGTGVTDTVGHGLDSAPELVFTKRTDDSAAWHIAGKDVTRIQFNTGGDDNNFGSTFAATTFSQPGGSQVANAEWNGDGANYIAYCFHSVDGYSKVGTYTGNGSSDGTFVYTGFKPAYVMTKKTSSTSNWLIFDNGRDTYNLAGDYLYANSSGSEGTSSSSGVDFLSNGFKPRNTYNDMNTLDADYIFIAFAEHPFKYSTAK